MDALKAEANISYAQLVLEISMNNIRNKTKIYIYMYRNYIDDKA